MHASAARALLAWGVSLWFGLVPPDARSAWRVQRVNDGARASCRLESDKAPIQDGYQTSSVQVLVTAQAVQVVSDSTLDGGSGDIGLQVDQQEFVKADRLGGEKVVIFASGAPVLISDFKAGLKLRLQLRFWPTWPETGNHSAVVSLIGFTKAWDEMHQTCH